MIGANTKHPNYDNQLLPISKDIFKPEFKRDSRGRYFMQLPGYGKWMVSVEPGSKIIAQGSEDEKGGPGTDPGSLRTGSLHAETVISIGDNIYLDGGTGCIHVGDYQKRVASSISICGEGMRGYVGSDTVFAFFLEKDGDFGVGDFFIGDYGSDNYVLWDDSEGYLYIKGKIYATSGEMAGWEIDTCLKKEYIISAPSKTKIELCAGNPGHIQAAYSPTGSFSLPGDLYMVQITQGSTGDAGGVPLPRLDIYRNGVKRTMLNQDGLYFFENDGTTVATSILSGVSNQENLSNVEITGGNISNQPVPNVGNVSNSVADAVPTSLIFDDTDIAVGDDGVITAYITLTWDAIITDTFDHYLIRYKRNSYTYYNYVETDETTITIDGLMPNVSFDFAIASVNKYGAVSNYSSTVTDTTAADGDAPNIPTGLIAIGGFKKMVLDWDANTDYDLKEYHIYRYTSNNSGASSKVGVSGSSQFIDDLSTVSYTSGESNETYYYWIKAVDTSRNASGFSTEAHNKSKLVDEDSVYYISASKILLDGTTYLTSWRHAKDFTKIDGGDIYANTVTVDEVNFTVIGTDEIVATINATDQGALHIDAKYIAITGATIFTSGWAGVANAEADIDQTHLQNSAAAGADVTQTIINGGLITTGTIRLSDGSNIKAGITAAGVGDSNIRFWAGQTYANRTIAPFRVTQGGSAVVSGTIYATAGYIGGSSSGWKIASNVLQAYSGVTKLIELSSSGPHIQCLLDSNNYVQMTPASSDPRFDIFVSGSRRVRLNADGLTFFTAGGSVTNKIGLGTTDGDATFGGGLVRLWNKGIRISHDNGACSLSLQDEGSTYLRMFVDESTRSYAGTIDLPNSDILTIRDKTGPPGNKIVDFCGRTGEGNNYGIADLFSPLGLLSASIPPTGASNGWMFYNSSYHEMWAYLNGSWQALGTGSGSGTVTQVNTSGAITGGPITTSGTIYHSTSNGYKHIPINGGLNQVLRNSGSGTASWTSNVYVGGNNNYYMYRAGSSPYDMHFQVPTGIDFAFRRGTSVDAKIDDNFWTQGNLYADGQLSVGGTITNTAGDIICNTGNLQLKKNGAIIAIDDSGGTTRYLTVQYNSTLGKYILST